MKQGRRENITTAKQIKIKIEYRNGTREEKHVDDYKGKDGVLCTYVRFGSTINIIGIEEI